MIYLRGTQLQTGDTRALIKVASPDFSATQGQTLRPEWTGPALTFYYGTGLARLWVSGYIPSENTSEKNQNVTLHLPNVPFMYESPCCSNTLNMCVRAHMRACVHACCGRACMCKCGGRKTTSAVIPQMLYTLFLRQGLSLAGNSPSRLDWLIREPRSLLSLLPSPGIISVCYHTQLFFLTCAVRCQPMDFTDWATSSISNLNHRVLYKNGTFQEHTTSTGPVYNGLKRM